MKIDFLDHISYTRLSYILPKISAFSGVNIGTGPEGLRILYRHTE
jgi:hypothetical protein